MIVIVSPRYRLVLGLSSFYNHLTHKIIARRYMANFYASNRPKYFGYEDAFEKAKKNAAEAKRYERIRNVTSSIFDIVKYK